MKIQILNFQSHKNTVLDLCPGVNAIIGNSGTGKSSVLRAINWLINNTPTGDDFVSWGGDCVVSISDDDWEVSRIKGKGKNQYAVRRNGAVQVYEGFGRDVPEPIKNLLNMQDFNLRFQYQKPFLIGESSGEVTRYLNRVARLDIIDKAMSNIDSRLRREKNQLDVETSVVEKTDIQLLKFKDVDQIECQVQEVESLDKDIKGQVYRYNGIYDSVKEIKSVQALRVECGKTVKMEKGVAVALVLFEEMRKVQKRFDSLEPLEQSASIIIPEIKRQKAVLKLSLKVGKIVLAINDFDELKSKRVGLKTLIEQLSDTSVNLKGALDYEQKCKTVFSQLMPDVCPLCGQGVK